MRTIDIDNVSQELKDLVTEIHPIDEDIGLLDKQGNLLGVIISQDAYEFFLRKTEEEEDRIDGLTVKEFHKSGDKYNEK